MNKVFGILLVGLVLSVLAVNESSWAAKNFKDGDWTHSFYERCSKSGGFANGSEVKWIKEGDTKFLRFSLSDGQKGNCSRDKIQRSYGPYWERSEISSGTNTKSKFRLATGNNYEIELRVRFVDGFASVRESIMQLYSECNWRGQCSPLLMLQSAGSYPHAGNLQIAALRKISTDEKPAGNWITAAIMEDYKQDYTYFQNNQKSWRDKTRDLKCPISNSYFCKTQFVPMAHKNKWIKLLFIVSVKVEKVFISAQVKSPDGVWTIPNLKKLDRPPATLDPHIELGIYRPGSTSNSNPTSVIDFDYIKIKKISQAEFEQAQKEVYLTPGSLTKVDKTKYDRTKAGMEMRFKCFTDYARAKNLNDVPLQTEIETLITSFVGNNYYRSHRQIVKAGITQKSMDANKAALIRVVNFEGTNEEYCAKPIL